MPNVIEHDQFEIVNELLKRQDSALEQLQDLNDRVEAAIKDVTQQRERELAQLGAELDELDSQTTTQETALQPLKEAA